jgi:predicted glycoside hydrolase/deacetylase ChbG (UPF0249 family)
MPVRLHADDLGLHPAVDRAIFRAFEAGAIAGASILATGPTFPEAARQARALGLPVSLHLAVVDTAPISPPAEVPSLVGADGRFPRGVGGVVRRALLGDRPGGLRPAELRLEIGRQLQALAEAGLIRAGGLQVDGHQHLHLLPVVFAALLQAGARFSLTAFRLPLRSPPERRQMGARSLGFAVAERLGRRAARAARRRGIAAIPCWGVLYAGHLTVTRARAVLAALPPGADGELICHPGDDDRALGTLHPWGYAWEAELATVLALAGLRPGMT